MTGRRLSKRDTSVTKRKELEDKQKKKAEEANLRKEKARSKALKQLQDQELQLFTEEAVRLSDLVESLEFSPNKATDNLTLSVMAPWIPWVSWGGVIVTRNPIFYFL